ncbi:MAG: tetratricopeptide repeat protein [Colwellia sp.]|nr:tetratricopeptide repeat protein [Colwellia sp.]
MNVKNILNKAKTFFKRGEFEQSIQICQKILEKKPKLFDVRKTLALSYQSSGQIKLALEEFEKVLLIKSKDADTFNNIGNIYLDIQQYTLAEKYYRIALKHKPLLAQAWNNLATCQLRTGNKLDAEVNFRKAIMFGGNVSLFHSNLAEMLIDQGAFDKALKILLTSLELNHHTPTVYRNVLSIFMYQQRYQDALEIADMGLLSENLSESELCELLVNKAILFWLFDNPDEARQAIHLSEAVYQYRKNSVELGNLCVFHSYIKQLLELNKQRLTVESQGSPEANIYFISESHGFTPNDNTVEYKSKLYNIRSLFILGAKIVHLIEDKNNKHKQSLSLIFSNLPSGSKIVMAVGEIDCRRNEGIFVHCIKHELDYKDVINDMLLKYIDMLKGQAEKYDFEVILYGIPAPNQNQVDVLEVEQQEPFKQLIKYFNQQLGKICQENNISFLDTYLLTAENGVSNLQYHLDSFHLNFEAVPQLFNNLK